MIDISIAARFGGVFHRIAKASEVVRAGLRMLEDFEAEREKWLREEIPSRMAELQRDPAKGIPANACRPEVCSGSGRHASKQRLKARRLNPFQCDAL
ncbi:type II toxin-antitoxin system ParD family antitoxin [Mesorhizobium sp. WSM3224]|uniref:type II toxin-antitoxin system ParD family antitoxin n=1 Tax=Mesorhizobium sp. WSM3224 TaxID=1040986 RepID=UPI00040C5024|nr:type II toxin-antitoxin system ParD family antitoxin [Mesorhizobium sp. WSM3224]